MERLSPGVFKVQDGETITIDGTASGTQWLVTAVAYNQNLPQQKPITITMDKARAQNGSFVPNARSTDVVLGFTFDHDAGGSYSFTVTGSAGGSSPGSVQQAGKAMESVTYTFHIV